MGLHRPSESAADLGCRQQHDRGVSALADRRSTERQNRRDSVDAMTVGFDCALIAAIESEGSDLRLIVARLRKRGVRPFGGRSLIETLAERLQVLRKAGHIEYVVNRWRLTGSTH
jgi:hypothetical protein